MFPRTKVPVRKTRFSLGKNPQLNHWRVFFIYRGGVQKKFIKKKEAMAEEIESGCTFHTPLE